VNTLYKLMCLILFLSVSSLVAGCGKKAEEPATAEETGAVAESAAPGALPEDLTEAFQAKVAEADAYMTAHDVKNTPREEIAVTLEGFQRDFDDLRAKAAGDDELSARCALAAEGMSLYVKSLRMPADDLEQMQVAIDAEVKWTQAKEAAAGEPQT
jgi:hypothetical protein